MRAGDPDTPPVVVEVEQDYAPTEAAADRSVRDLGAILAVGLLVLYALLLPIAYRTSRTLREQTGRLRDQAEKLRAFIDHMPAVLWTTDGDLRFTQCLGAALASLDLSPERVVGMTLFQFFGTDDPQFPPLAAHRSAMEGRPATYEVAWGGRSLQGHVEPLRNDQGRIEGTIGVALDVTARREAERSVREAEAKYRVLVEGIPAISYTAGFGETATWYYVSPQIERMLGFTAREWMSEPGLWFERIHPEDRDRVMAEEGLSRDSLHALASEYRVLARDGRLVWVRDEAKVVRDQEGAARFFQGVMYDVT